MLHLVRIEILACWRIARPNSRFFLRRRFTHRPAIIRQWMRRALLQGFPNRVADVLSFASQTRIPKAQHSDASRFDPFIPFRIFGLLRRHPMHESVQFNIDPRFHTEKIKDVRTKRVLASKFVLRESPITKPTPDKFFRPSIALSKHTRCACQFGRCHTLKARRREIVPQGLLAERLWVNRGVYGI